MSNLYIDEFPNIDYSFVKNPQFCKFPPTATQKVSLGSNSNPLDNSTHLVRLMADAICSIAISRGPLLSGQTLTAAITNTRLAANVPEYVGVTPGSVISTIANT